MKREIVKGCVRLLCDFGSGMIGGMIYGTTLAFANPASKALLKKSALFLTSSGLGFKISKIASEEWNEVIDAAFDFKEKVEREVNKYGRTTYAGEGETFDGTYEER